MTRVVHIITGLGRGGAEATLFKVCSGVVNHEHIVISLDDEGVYAEPLRQAGATVHVIPMRPLSSFGGGMWRLVKLLRELHPDLVQTWLYHADVLGGLAARMAGIRNVVWSLRNGNLSPEAIGRATAFAVRLAARLSSRIPVALITCSASALALHEQAGYQIARTSLIPNGVNTDLFKPDANARARVREEMGVADDVRVVGFVARFDRQKDHRNLLEAFARLREQYPQWRLMLIGKDCDTNNSQLVSWCDELGVRNAVILVGPRPDVQVMMSAMDLFVLSSLGEAFPNVLAEAMACGLPCVTTDVGDAALILDAPEYVVPSRDVVSLAQAMARLYEVSDSERIQIGLRNRQRVDGTFSLNAMLQAYNNYYDDFAKARQRGI